MHEGTTFEASCYTDPLAIEHLTGSLSATIAWFGALEAVAQLQFTSKFAAVEPLLGHDHHGRTRIRASVNPVQFAQFEGGTSPVAVRLAALAAIGRANYLICLTVAPIIAAEGLELAYSGLIAQAARALSMVPALHLTIELITHRHSPMSKAVLDKWYPGSALPMEAVNRTEKRTKFGSIKHVYDADTMRTLRGFFEAEIARALPAARILYWT